MTITSKANTRHTTLDTLSNTQRAPSNAGEEISTNASLKKNFDSDYRRDMPTPSNDLLTSASPANTFDKSMPPQMRHTRAKNAGVLRHDNKKAKYDIQYQQADPNCKYKYKNAGALKHDDKKAKYDTQQADANCRYKNAGVPRHDKKKAKYDTQCQQADANTSMNNKQDTTRKQKISDRHNATSSSKTAHHTSRSQPQGEDLVSIGATDNKKKLCKLIESKCEDKTENNTSGTKSAGSKSWASIVSTKPTKNVNRFWSVVDSSIFNIYIQDNEDAANNTDETKISDTKKLPWTQLFENSIPDKASKGTTPSSLCTIDKRIAGDEQVAGDKSETSLSRDNTVEKNQHEQDWEATASNTKQNWTSAIMNNFTSESWSDFTRSCNVPSKTNFKDKSNSSDTAVSRGNGSKKSSGRSTAVSGNTKISAKQNATSCTHERTDLNKVENKPDTIHSTQVPNDVTSLNYNHLISKTDTSEYIRATSTENEPQETEYAIQNMGALKAGSTTVSNISQSKKKSNTSTSHSVPVATPNKFSEQKREPSNPVSPHQQSNKSYHNIRKKHHNTKRFSTINDNSKGSFALSPSMEFDVGLNQNEENFAYGSNKAKTKSELHPSKQNNSQRSIGLHHIQQDDCRQSLIIDTSSQGPNINSTRDHTTKTQPKNRESMPSRKTGKGSFDASSSNQNTELVTVANTSTKKQNRRALECNDVLLQQNSESSDGTVAVSRSTWENSTHSQAKKISKATGTQEVATPKSIPSNCLCSESDTSNTSIDDSNVVIIVEAGNRYGWSKDEMILGMTAPTDSQPVITHFRPSKESFSSSKRRSPPSPSQEVCQEYDEKWRLIVENEKSNNLAAAFPTNGLSHSSGFLHPKEVTLNKRKLSLSCGNFGSISNTSYLNYPQQATAYEANGMVYYGVNPNILQEQDCHHLCNTDS